MPSDSLSIGIVLDGEASLVMVLLQALNRNSNVKLGVDGTLLQALVVVRLAGSRSKGKRQEEKGVKKLHYKEEEKKKLYCYN